MTTEEDFRKSLSCIIEKFGPEHFSVILTIAQNSSFYFKSKNMLLIPFKSNSSFKRVNVKYEECAAVVWKNYANHKYFPFPPDCDDWYCMLGDSFESILTLYNVGSKMIKMKAFI